MSKVADQKRAGTVKMTPTRGLVSRPTDVKAERSGNAIKLDIRGVKVKLIGSGELRLKFGDGATGD